MDKKVFKTAISLTYEQAVACVNSIYTSHSEWDGESNVESYQKYMNCRDKLIDLLTSPIGTEVEVETKWGSSYIVRSTGYTTFTFVRNSKKKWFLIARDETSTPKDIAFVFLHARSFGRFKTEWNNRLGMFWRTKEVTQ